MNKKATRALTTALAVLVMSGALFPAQASAAAAKEKSTTTSAVENKAGTPAPAPIKEPRSGAGYEELPYMQYHYPDIAWDGSQGGWVYTDWGMTKILYPDGSRVTLSAPEPTQGHGSESARRCGAKWVPQWEAWVHKQTISGTIALIYPNGSVKYIRDEEQIAIAEELLANWIPATGEGKDKADLTGAVWDTNRGGWVCVDDTGKTKLISPSGLTITI